MVRKTWSVLVLLAFAAPQAWGQGKAAEAGHAYPTKPIRILVPFTPGSATDFLARQIGPRMTDSWGQQVVVDNRPSAGGVVAGETVAHATPDGHTLLLNSSAIAGSAALYSTKMPYDTVKDFAGVSQVAYNAVLLVVGPGLGVKSVGELIALAREKPAQMTYGSSGIGSGTHYVAELFKLATRVSAVHVPYRGSPEAITDTIAGRLTFSFVPIPPALSLVRSGRLTGLAVTTTTRSNLMPDTPTVAEAGVPGFEYSGWFGVFAPSKTARGIVKRLNAEIVRILALPEVSERFQSQGVAARSSTPEALETLVRGEIETRRKIFAAAGVRPE